MTIDQILAWADAFRTQHERWPRADDGPIDAQPPTSWGAVNAALTYGRRGLPGGSSLAQLLAEHRGHRNIRRLAPLTEEQILAWADAHHERTGQWPSVLGGPIPDTDGEIWVNVDASLKHGCRGLPGGSSLARLLAEQRGVPNQANLPPLTPGRIVRWADEHHRRTGQWPRRISGDVVAAPGESWSAIDGALVAGCRGLPGGSSLAKLLAKYRGVRNPKGLPSLTIEGILAWADAHHRRTGQWPGARSGPVTGARPAVTWRAVEEALRLGCRGLPGGTTLRRLLREHGRGGN